MSVNATVLLYVDIVPELSLMLLYYCMLIVFLASGCLVSDSSASQQSSSYICPLHILLLLPEWSSIHSPTRLLRIVPGLPSQ